MKLRRNLILLLTVGIAAVAAASIVALSIGTFKTGVFDVIAALFGYGDAASAGFVAGRLPRVLLALGVGAALAVSGATYQSILRNPLADPFVLGVSGGAAVAVVLVEITPVGFYISRLAAGVCGAGGAMALVYVLSLRRGRLSPLTMLLVGVIVNAVCSALMMLLMTFAEEKLMSDIIGYLMGSFEGALVSARMAALFVAMVGIVSAVMFFLSARLNALAVGEDVAAGVGVNVERTKRISFAAASVLVGVSVVLTGPIGFVGLVVPHALRLILGSDYRLLIPASFFGGAAFLLVCDTAVRLVSVSTHKTLPVGVITALVCAPFFIVLLRRQLRGALL